MTTINPRHPFAHSPLLKQGGAHQRSASGARCAGHQQLLAELDDWYLDRDDGVDTQQPSSKEDAAGKPGCGPVFLRLGIRHGGRPLARPLRAG